MAQGTEVELYRQGFCLFFTSQTRGVTLGVLRRGAAISKLLWQEPTWYENHIDRETGVGLPESHLSVGGAKCSLSTCQ